jgi:hypothetical protein
MNPLFEHIANRPWILIWVGFFLLISVWTIFMVIALRNQPERLPLTNAPVQQESLYLEASAPPGAENPQAAREAVDRL